MTNWDDIKSEWETTKITLATLAEKHDIKLGTLKSRKSREGWSRDLTKKDATKKKHGGQSGNKGNPIWFNNFGQFIQVNCFLLPLGIKITVLYK